MAQLLNKFHEENTILPTSSSFLNDTNQLNRSARYIHQDINQFRSIEHFELPPLDDFQFQDLIYHESGNVICYCYLSKTCSSISGTEFLLLNDFAVNIL